MTLHELVNGERSGASASERIASQLRGEILAGAILPGERIRQEEVAARLGGSRLPVREALRMLEVEGLVEIYVHRGARVPLLSEHEVGLLYQMRERLETLAIVESLPSLTAEQLQQLTSIQESIEENTDVAEFLDLDRDFHHLTYAGCAMSQLTTDIQRLWNCTQHYRREFMLLTGPARRWVVNAEHRLIIDALERHDPVDAERYLGGHIRRTRMELGQHPEIYGLPS